MSEIIRSIKDIFRSIYKGNKWLIPLCFLISIGSGIVTPLFVWVNAKVLDLGIAVALNKMSFTDYISYLVLFCFCLLLPQLFSILLYCYIEPESALILRTTFKGKMLQKLKKMRYEHFESEKSLEIIEKAYSRAEEATLHIFPSYFFRFISSSIATVGTLYIFTKTRWWLLLTILIPYILDTWFATNNRFNIYDEMESYWSEEHRYSVLGNMLKTREYIRENQLFGITKFLISTYRSRMHVRNRKFESFYFENLRHHFLQQNIARFAQLGNAVILLFVFLQGDMAMGQLVSMTIAVFTSLGTSLEGISSVVKSISYQTKFYEYYNKYFALSEDEYGNINEIPQMCSIEFRNVSFTYPGSNIQVLTNLSFKIDAGERVAIVGKNGEGKTTLIKLLLGLYQPDAGDIYIGGVPLSAYSRSAKEKLFAPVFQDFSKYDITLLENVGVGDISKIHDVERFSNATHKAKLDCLLKKLPNGMHTLLGRNFSDSVDLSGGEWQRIAIARAFMSDNPVMILDEPTSQLDPMAESEIYSDFAAMVEDKTAIFITHRLGATMITDRILVLENGTITQSGTHTELMHQHGLYKQMFNAQKQWYEQSSTDTYK